MKGYVPREGPARVSGKTIFSFALQASQQVPPATSAADGTCSVTLDETSGDVAVGCSYDGLVGDAFAAHIHGPAAFPGGEVRGQIAGGEGFRASDCIEVLSPGAAPIGAGRSGRSVRTNRVGAVTAPSR